MIIDIGNMPIYLDNSDGSITRDRYTLLETLDRANMPPFNTRYIKVSDFLTVLEINNITIIQ